MAFDKVAVFMGGISSEREISLKSGRAVTEGLRAAGYRVTPVELDHAALPPLPEGTEAVFLALHGCYGEDGGVQQDLDRIGIPYTGSGARASRLAMDKVASKRVFIQYQVPTPEFALLGADETRPPAVPAFPVVVKPPREGSSVGISRVDTADAWPAAVAAARPWDSRGELLVERYIPGREWTVGVLGAEALPVIEIRAPDGWYDFNAKYGGSAGAARPPTEYLFPDAPEDRALTARVRQLALRAFQAVGCRGLGRVDFRVSADGIPYALEINTIPGFTATSLLPKAAARAGLPFPQLCERIMETACFDGVAASAV